MCNPGDWVPYIKHWEEEKAKLEKELTTIRREYTRSLNAALDAYADFRRLMDKLLDILADMNILTEDIHVGTDFEALLDRITKPAWASSIGHDQYGLFAELTVKSVTQRFRWIVPGAFLMGSPEDEPEREADETRHHATLTQGYWLADTACTQTLWRVVMESNPSCFQDDDRNPVEQVSWNDVQQFIDKLNGLIPNLNARLPTEARWEYACRAETTTPFSFGKNITPEQVNYNGEYPYAGSKKGLYRRKTVPVKSLSPNPWGLYEMHGNVWERCEDWFGDYLAAPVIDPVGPSEGTVRVLRGGSWMGDGGSTRSAYRLRFDPDSRHNAIGFRLSLGVVDRNKNRLGP